MASSSSSSAAAAAAGRLPLFLAARILLLSLVVFTLFRLDLLTFWRIPGPIVLFLILRRIRAREAAGLRQTNRLQSLQSGFAAQVQLVADSVLMNQDDDSDHQQETIQLPEKPIYKVELQETVISDKKTSTILRDGRLLHQVTLSVALERDDTQNGWKMQGSRNGGGEGHFTIHKGFVTASGKAYWHEVSTSYEMVVVGQFHQSDDSSFTGEWLSSDGSRGQYSMTQLADDDSRIEIASGLPVLSIPFVE